MRDSQALQGEKLANTMFHVKQFSLAASQRGATLIQNAMS
jgi:hypothetical protein